MSLLKRAWKATEVDRDGIAQFWKKDAGSEILFVLWGLAIIALPVAILGALGFAVWSMFR